MGYFIINEPDLIKTNLLFTFLYIEISVNRFNIKRWLLLNSYLHFFQLKEKANILICLGFQAKFYTENI